MLTRRHALVAPLAAVAALEAAPGTMQLSIHQTTSSAAGYRKSLEGYARAGVKYVEVIPPDLEAFVKTEGMPAARRLLEDLGLKAVSCGGVRGLWESNPARAQALEDLRSKLAMAAELGVDRMVCPSITSGKYTGEDYRRGVDRMQEAGEIAAKSRITPDTSNAVYRSSDFGETWKRLNLSGPIDVPRALA